MVEKKNESYLPNDNRKITQPIFDKENKKLK